MLGENKGRMLFEIMPDLFPEGTLTVTEMELWELHYRDQAARYPAMMR